MSKLIIELCRVYRVLPFWGFIKWVFCFFMSLPKIIASRSLHAVDLAFGGRVIIKFSGHRIQLNQCDFGVIREIFGAQSYGRSESFRETRHVVDFGANAGAFTLFALASNQDLVVYSVETQPDLAESLRCNVEANGWSDRCIITNAFIGEATTEWAKKFRHEHPAVASLSVEAFFAEIPSVDFLKCDIEGAEFSLFSEAENWTQKVKEMSVEYHWNYQDGARLEEIIKSLGFQTQLRGHGALGYVDAKRAINDDGE